MWWRSEDTISTSGRPRDAPLEDEDTSVSHWVTTGPQKMGVLLAALFAKADIAVSMNEHSVVCLYDLWPKFAFRL